MEIEKYFETKKELQNIFLEYVEAKNEDEQDYDKLIHYIKKEGTLENKNGFNLFLLMLAKIGKNHHRNSYFINKIRKILLYLATKIKQTFSNQETFKIFKNNKLILHFLIHQKIIEIDTDISNKIIFESKNEFDYFYFLPELKTYMKEEKYKSIEDKLNEENPTFFDDFEQKRLIGENESYVCSLIRKDSVEEFVRYVNQTNLSISSQIANSIFETNPFLIKNKKTSLIEYAAFFGSIEIYQYLRLNKADLNSSLWLYSIHGKNAEIIHLLEQDDVKPPDDSFEICLKESIKCHHNEIANYIEINLIDEKEMELNIKNRIDHNILDYCFHYHNYICCPSNYDINLIIFYICKYNYIEIIKLFIQNENASVRGNIEIITLLLSVKGISICNNCFEQNAKLKGITIPSSVVSIGNSAFNECFSLQKVIFCIPSSIESIGCLSFKSCIKLNEISIPPSVVTIGKRSFEGCYSLKKIIFDSKSQLKLIDSCAFKGCTSLVQINLPSSLITIKNNAFSECTLLKQILLPSSIKTIENKAFEGCLSLTEIKLPPLIDIINENVFSQCSSLECVSINSPIKEIKSNAFKDCKKLKEISFPFNSLIKIDSHAFASCLSLEKISLPSSLKIIDFFSFNKCTSLKEIIIPSSVTKIGQFAFSDCSSLSQILISSSLISISLHAFSKCISLQQVTIPSSVTSIDSSAFECCSSLKEIVIPSSVTKIGYSSFYGCSSLTNISIPKSVTEIGNGAFENCSSLAQIFIPSSINIDKIGLNSNTKVILIE